MPAARGLTLLGLVLLSWATACSQPASPNLLLITVDTLRADRLSCYGGPGGVGREICALGESGTRFQWAFSTAASTAPAMTSMLTSLYLPQHEVWQDMRSKLDPKFETLASELKKGGYQTAAFVSNPVLWKERQLDRGFDHYDDEMSRREPGRPNLRERAAAATTDAALAWAREATGPWFIWVHYQDPHGPYLPPGATLPEEIEGSRKLRVLNDASGFRGIPIYQKLADLRGLQTYEEMYLAEIRYADRQIGRLLRSLDSLGPRPGVLLTADHGEAFGEDAFYMAHGHSPALELVRVPMLWRPPAGGPSGGLVRESVSLVDVAPTLLHLAGLPIPGSFRGRSLPLDGSEGPARVIFTEQMRFVAAILEGRYYTRERHPGSPNWNGGAWSHFYPDLPPRVAELGRGPALPPYVPAAEADTSEIEPPLEAFLGAWPLRIGNWAREEVSDELRAQLHELGYLLEPTPPESDSPGGVDEEAEPR